jgi:hypothetical protein
MVYRWGLSSFALPTIVAMPRALSTTTKWLHWMKVFNAYIWLALAHRGQDEMHELSTR